MNALQTLVESPVVQRLGWTLLHSAWQGLAIAIVLVILLPAPRRPGGVRGLLRRPAADHAGAGHHVLPDSRFAKNAERAGREFSRGARDRARRADRAGACQADGCDCSLDSACCDEERPRAGGTDQGRLVPQSVAT
jgi:hypothetical protein